MPRRDRSPRLAHMTYEEARALLDQGATAFLPTGATEAHGPHLPLSTDVIIAGTAAERAARLLLDEGLAAAVLPPIAYAVTEYAADFGGTLSLPEDTARALLRDTILASVRAGFQEVVVCNAHLEPANIQAIGSAVVEARAEGAKVDFPDVTKKPHALRLGAEFKSGACHAGSYETSLVMAAQPFLVRREVGEALEPNPISLSVAIRAGKKTFLEAGGEHAYFGDPAAATEAEGNTHYETLADIFAEAARALRALRG